MAFRACTNHHAIEHEMTQLGVERGRIVIAMDNDSREEIFASHDRGQAISQEEDGNAGRELIGRLNRPLSSSIHECLASETAPAAVAAAASAA